ncbi:hypothetical protein ACH427_30310 [Streptomyces sp. NPDC020379]|uniref:hypothetical protein n=1 Tax=Streptomyces sp. NPDC020379 TaxID=3365071 RepID=UPI0037B32E66
MRPVPPGGTREAPSRRSLLEIRAGRLAPLGYEGVVRHHPDGRMAELKVPGFLAPTDR